MFECAVDLVQRACHGASRQRFMSCADELGSGRDLLEYAAVSQDI
jgi:hypothetical protein